MTPSRLLSKMYQSVRPFVSGEFIPKGFAQSLIDDGYIVHYVYSVNYGDPLLVVATRQGQAIPRMRVGDMNLAEHATPCLFPEACAICPKCSCPNKGQPMVSHGHSFTADDSECPIHHPENDVLRNLSLRT